ncbi:MAG TPA: hypothetical protein VF622_05215 [Segetibacter sp.]
MEIQNLILALSNYKIFCNQLEDLINTYPNLAIKESGGEKYVKGILDVPNDLGDTVGSFLIEIRFAPKFPFRFPDVYEVGGIIPNEADWHKYPDHRCCLTVEPDEILKCKNSITLKEFVANHVFAFLANYIYRKETGVYKNGDYGHWIIGIHQFYSELLKTKDYNLWLVYFENVFRHKPYKKDRNVKCFCESDLIFKKCHKLVFDTLREIGEEQVLKDFKTIIKECENYLSAHQQKDSQLQND